MGQALMAATYAAARRYRPPVWWWCGCARPAVSHAEEYGAFDAFLHMLFLHFYDMESSISAPARCRDEAAATGRGVVTRVRRAPSRRMSRRVGSRRTVRVGRAWGYAFHFIDVVFSACRPREC